MPTKIPKKLGWTRPDVKVRTTGTKKAKNRVMEMEIIGTGAKIISPLDTKSYMLVYTQKVDGKEHTLHTCPYETHHDAFMAALDTIEDLAPPCRIYMVEVGTIFQAAPPAKGRKKK